MLLNDKIHTFEALQKSENGKENQHKMNKKHVRRAGYIPTNSKQQKLGPSPLAGRLLLIGLPLILAGVCDLAARMYAGLMAGEVGILLRFDEDIGSLILAGVVLFGGALILEYTEQRCGR